MNKRNQPPRPRLFPPRKEREVDVRVASRSGELSNVKTGQTRDGYRVENDAMLVFWVCLFVFALRICLAKVGQEKRRTRRFLLTGVDVVAGRICRGKTSRPKRTEADVGKRTYAADTMPPDGLDLGPATGRLSARHSSSGVTTSFLRSRRDT